MTMRRSFHLLLVCMQCTFLFSQKTTYQFPEKFNQVYNFHPDKSYEKLKGLQIQGFTEEQLEVFKIEKIYESQRGIDGNACYLNWFDLENYIYAVLDTIIPYEVRKKEPYTVFINRDEDINASALGNGFVYVNIGLFAFVEDEAGFANVLAHEIAHSLFNHGYNTNVDMYAAYNSGDVANTSREYYRSYDKYRRAELQADSFAYACLQRAGLNLNSALNNFKSMDFLEKNNLHYVDKNHRGAYTEYMSLFATHPSGQERRDYIQKMISKQSAGGRRFMIDSTYFGKIRKTAIEECKKLSYEHNHFTETLRFAFSDYLLGNSTPKNQFYIIESIRRMLYLDPSMSRLGFLGEDLQYSEFANTNYSILKLPEMLFNSADQFAKAQKHALLTAEQKPFNTYEQAFFYFTDQALAAGLNEANFSKALYYYAQKKQEEFTTYVDAYLAKGGGLYTEFATNLKENGMPKLPAGKITLIIDNANRYSAADNYYQAMQRRKFNPEIKAALGRDTSKVQLVYMNELMGQNPKLLYTYQKLNGYLLDLYTEQERERRFYKKRVHMPEDVGEQAKRTKYNKHLMIFAPEWFAWAKDNGSTGVCVQNIKYEYKTPREPQEFHNYYLLSYFDFNDNRPYFGKCNRTATFRKQSHKDMITDLTTFLFRTE